MCLKRIYTPFRIIQYEAFTNVTIKYLIGTRRPLISHEQCPSKDTSRAYSKTASQSFSCVASPHIKRSKTKPRRINSPGFILLLFKHGLCLVSHLTRYFCCEVFFFLLQAFACFESDEFLHLDVFANLV